MKIIKHKIAIFCLLFFTSGWANETCPNLEIMAICKKAGWRFQLNENFPADWELVMDIHHGPCQEGEKVILKFSKAVYYADGLGAKQLQCSYQKLPVSSDNDIGTINIISTKHIYNLGENNLLTNWLLPSDLSGAVCEGVNLTPEHCPIKLK